MLDPECVSELSGAFIEQQYLTVEIFFINIPCANHHEIQNIVYIKMYQGYKHVIATVSCQLW